MMASLDIFVEEKSSLNDSRNLPLTLLLVLGHPVRIHTIHRVYVYVSCKYIIYTSRARASVRDLIKRTFETGAVDRFYGGPPPIFEETYYGVSRASLLIIFFN